MNLMTEKQKNVLLDILSVLDYYSQQKNQNVQNFQQAKLKALKWIDEAILTQELNIFVQVLEYLTSIKNKQDSFQITYLTNINYAFMIQEQWKQSDLDTYPKNSQLIKNAIKSLQICLDQKNPQNKTDQLNDVKYLYTLIKNYLQLAASLSQEQNNKSAYQKCVKSMKVFLKLTKILISLTNNQISDCKSLSDLNNKNQKKFFEKFQSYLLFIQNIFEEILHHILMEDYGKPNDQFFHISQQNQEFLQKQEKISVQWLNKITIQNFMHLEYYSIQKLEHQIKVNEIFSEGFVSLIIILSSTILFCLSTEKRINTFKNLQDENSSHFKIQPLFEQTQEQKIKKIPSFKFSERLHYLSLHIIESYFEKTDFYVHLQQSYEDHFNSKLDLQAIPEEESQVFSKCSKLYDFKSSVFEYSMEKSLVLENSTAISNNFQSNRHKDIQEKIIQLKQSYILTQSQDLNDIKDLINSQFQNKQKHKQLKQQQSKIKKNQILKIDNPNKKEKLKINNNKLNTNSQKNFKEFVQKCKLFTRKVQNENKKLKKQKTIILERSRRKKQDSSKQKINSFSISKYNKSNTRGQSNAHENQINLFKKKFFSNQNFIDQVSQDQKNKDFQQKNIKKIKLKVNLPTSKPRQRSLRSKKLS